MAMLAYVTRAMERGGSMDNPNTASFSREIKLEQQVYDLQQDRDAYSRKMVRLERALEEMTAYAIYGLDGIEDKSVTRAIERAQAALALAKEGKVESHGKANT